MSLLVLTQILFNILFGIALFIIWVRLQKEPQDDPRLSKGLQILQTKISILEDLSDRTDRQVKNLCTIIEKKSKEIEQSISDSEEQLAKIHIAMKNSVDAAEIFQNNDEVLERKQSQKYIDAAVLAHKGLSAEEIAEKIDLSSAEIEFITKVNRERLMFSEENLPSWAKKKVERDFSDVFSQNHYDELKNLGEKFRQASFVDQGNETSKQSSSTVKSNEVSALESDSKQEILKTLS